MRLPLRINWQALPAALRPPGATAADPRDIAREDLSPEAFERAVSRFKIDGTWRTTWTARQPVTDALLEELRGGRTDLHWLEVGASCGSTTLDLLGRLNGGFGRYYATDLFQSLPVRRAGPVWYFYHPKSAACIMRVSDRTIAYHDVEAALPPLGWLASRLVAHGAGAAAGANGSVDLIRPELRAAARRDPRIVLLEHDCMRPWSREPVDVIKIANVLNRVSFEPRTIRDAAGHLMNALRPGGHLVVTDNRDTERVSVFRRSPVGGLALVRSVAGGTDVERALA